MWHKFIDENPPELQRVLVVTNDGYVFIGSQIGDYTMHGDDEYQSWHLEDCEKWCELDTIVCPWIKTSEDCPNDGRMVWGYSEKLGSFPVVARKLLDDGQTYFTAVSCGRTKLFNHNEIDYWLEIPEPPMGDDKCIKK